MMTMASSGDYNSNFCVSRSFFFPHFSLSVFECVMYVYVDMKERRE